MNKANKTNNGKSIGWWWLYGSYAIKVYSINIWNNHWGTFVKEIQKKAKLEYNLLHYLKCRNLLARYKAKNEVVCEKRVDEKQCANSGEQKKPNYWTNIALKHLWHHRLHSSSRISISSKVDRSEFYELRQRKHLNERFNWFSADVMR